jgi:hypothetical protein
MPSEAIFAGLSAMRDWILAFAPIAATTYFLVYPDRFRELLAWLTILVQ